MRGMVMAEDYELEDSVRSILNSPGGQMINDASDSKEFARIETYLNEIRDALV